MGRWRVARTACGFAAVSLILLALSPLVIVAGEWVNRRYLRGPGRFARTVAGARAPRRGTAPPVFATWHRHAGWVARWVISNPVWIVLTAPGRWVADRLRRPRAGHGRPGGGPWPPGAGDREPRNPRPDLPAGVIALPEPPPGS